MSLSIGLNAETIARRYLQQRGLEMVQQNFRCRRGEIDLIMREGNYVVFVEVRCRTHQQFGGALASVDRHKQKHIIATANYFLYTKNWTERYPCRFDVVGLIQQNDAFIVKQWIRDAFRVNYRV